MPLTLEGGRARVRVLLVERDFARVVRLRRGEGRLLELGELGLQLGLLLEEGLAQILELLRRERGLGGHGRGTLAPPSPGANDIVTSERVRGEPPIWRPTRPRRAPRSRTLS